MTLRIYNEQTGELLGPDYYVRNRKQDEAYKRKQEGRSHDFTASNMRNLHEVYSVLTTAQCGYLMLLQCYVNYDGGVLVNSDRTPMTTSDMLAVLQLTKKQSTFYDFLNACLNAEIIVKSDVGYSVNERYHFRGAFNDQYVVKSYTAKVKRVYREVKASDIGLIYRMLPYVHMDTNALCTNPFEKTPEQIRWFNRKELAEAIGITPQALGARLPKMTFDGQYVIARVKLGGNERYMFNPWVFYRKDDTPDNTLRALFNTR